MAILDRMRRATLIGAVCACVAAAAGCADDERPVQQRQAVAAAPAPKTELPPLPEDPQPATETELPPLPEDHRPKVVEPVAGAATPAPAAEPRPRAQAAPDPGKPSGAAAPNVDLDRPVATGDGVHEATALPNGIALPPLEAPERVRRMIEAGNVIARSPYLWGGGHGKWVDTGYDCSGSVSFVLAAAGYLEAPLASGPLMSWGEPGPGKWVSIYAHEGHVWMTVAGIRFDTSGRAQTGSRWQNEMRSSAGFTVRHPPGL